MWLCYPILLRTINLNIIYCKWSIYVLPDIFWIVHLCFLSNASRHPSNLEVECWWILVHKHRRERKKNCVHVHHVEAISIIYAQKQNKTFFRKMKSWGKGYMNLCGNRMMYDNLYRIILKGNTTFVKGSVYERSKLRETAWRMFEIHRTNNKRVTNIV